MRKYFRKFNLAEATDLERKKLAEAYKQFLSLGIKEPLLVNKNINTNGDIFFTAETLKKEENKDDKF